MAIISVVKAIAKARSWDVEEIKAANIAKLKERFPDKFDTKAAYTRNTDAEAEAIEKVN